MMKHTNEKIIEKKIKELTWRRNDTGRQKKN